MLALFPRSHLPTVLSPCSDPKPGLVLGGTQLKRGTRSEPKFHLAWGSDRGGHMWQVGETRGQNSILVETQRASQRGCMEGEKEYERITQMSQSQATFLLILQTTTQQRQHQLET